MTVSVYSLTFHHLQFKNCGKHWNASTLKTIPNYSVRVSQVSRATCQRRIQPTVYNTDQKDLSANRSVLFKKKKDAEDRLLCDAFYLDLNITWWDFCPLTNWFCILKYAKSLPLCLFCNLCQILIGGKMRTFNREFKRRKKKTPKHGSRFQHRGAFLWDTQPWVVKGCWGVHWSGKTRQKTVSSVSGCITSLSNGPSAIKTFLIIYSVNKKPEGSNRSLLGPRDPCSLLHSLNVTSYQFLESSFELIFP